MKLQKDYVLFGVFSVFEVLEDCAVRIYRKDSFMCMEIVNY